MEQILDTPVENQPPREYAGFWIRFVAYFIDAILLGIINIILSLFILTGNGIGESNIGLNLLSFMMGLLYFALMESSENQATLGKMALGLKVGNISGQRISFPNALGRYMGKIVSVLTLLIGFMMAGWDDRKQALHDKMADTFVFYK